MFGLTICNIRFFRRVKQTQSYGFVAYFYLGQPLTVFAANTLKPALVACVTTVVRILDVCRLSQIAKSVVVALPVDMIYLVLRPISGYVQPRKPMCQIQRIIYADSPVTVLHSAPSYLSWRTAAARLLPSKLSCIGVVAYQFAQSLCGKAHKMPLSKHDIVNVNRAVCGGQAR